MMTNNRSRSLRRPPWARRQNVQDAPESTETPNAAHRDPYATQIIDPALVAWLFRWIVWLALAVSFTMSAVGNTRPFGGDITKVVAAGWPNWTYLTSAPWLIALASAAVSQLIIQIFQFKFAQHRRDWKIYWLLIALSVAFSLYTFAPLLNLIQSWYKLGYVWIYGGAAIVLALNDRAQEWALQKRG